MAIKTHKVTLSLDNPRVIQSGINVQSFDKQSIQISIELTKNDEVFQVPSDATIRVSLLKLARQEQKIIVDVPNTNRESIDWIVPDYLDGYQGTVRVGVYLVSGTENVDLGYFTILSNVSDIDKMADEFTDNVFQGWEQIEADLNELNLTIAQTKLDLADDLTQIDNTIANINTLASDFTADVATKQTNVTNKYNAFDTSVAQANQTIDEILALQPQFQTVLDETTGKDVISAPEIILARGGAQTLGERLDSEKAEVTAQLAHNETQIFITDGLNASKYGAVGDGVKHSIKNTLPDVSLEDVKSLNSDATLDNSVDWYALQKALNTQDSTVYFDGEMVIDLPIHIKFNNTKLIGYNGKIYNSSTSPAFIIGEYGSENIVYTIKFKGFGVSGKGHGVLVKGVQWLDFEDVDVMENDGDGLRADQQSHIWNATFKGGGFHSNKGNGVYAPHSWNGQKNALSFQGCYISKNGTGDVATLDNGHGAVVSGTNIEFDNACTLESNRGFGIYAGGYNDTDQEIINGLTIANSYFEPNLAGDIYIDNDLVDAKGLNITGNGTATNKNNSTFGHLHVTNPGQIVEATSNVKANLPVVHEKYLKTNINRVTAYTLDSYEEYLEFDQNGQIKITIDYDFIKFSQDATLVLHLFMYDENFEQISTPSVNYINVRYLPVGEGMSYTTDTFGIITTGIDTIKKDIKYLKPRLSLINKGVADYAKVKKFEIKYKQTPFLKTINRPVLGTHDRGYTMYDSDLNKLITWYGAGWVDGTGTIL